MGYKGVVLAQANRIAASVSARRSLPTYFHGTLLWPSRRHWETLYSAYERPTAVAIKNNLRRGDCFWDIGANIGWFSLFAAKQVGRSGAVMAFEPSPEVFQALRSNIAHSANVQALQYGIGARDGVASFASQGMSTSASFVAAVTRINERHTNAPIRAIEVEVRTVDGLIRDGARPPDLLKVDVEGYELEVLRGSASLLNNERPGIIIEIHPPQLEMSGGTIPDIDNFLSEHSYDVAVIDRNPNGIFTLLALPTPIPDRHIRRDQ